MVLAPENLSLTLRRPEIPGNDGVALQLEVQRLVVHVKEPSRLALIAERGVKGQTYRLLLRLRGYALGELS